MLNGSFADCLQVIEPEPAPTPDVPGWEYYTPDDEDDA